MNAIDEIARTEVALFLLECGRIAGVIIVAPLAWLHAPVRVRVALVLLLAFFAHGMSIEARLPDSPILLASALVVELAVGVGMGLIVRFVVAIAEVSGEVISPAIGLGMASAFDPSTHAHQSQIASLLRYFVVFVALLTGLHRVLLGALLAGFRLLPVGTTGNVALALPGLVQLSSVVISVGVRVALPLVAILYMTQIALAFIARAAPQMQVFNVGFAVMLAVGLTVLAMILPDVARALVVELSQLGSRLEDLLVLFGARP
ncbi:MAG TPA: flagellar biosynthetic protein FliR [Polyangiaceae bacterium]